MCSDPSVRNVDNTLLVQIKQGFELPTFTSHFSCWDPELWASKKTYPEYLEEVTKEEVTKEEVTKEECLMVETVTSGGHPSGEEERTCMDGRCSELCEPCELCECTCCTCTML